MRINIIGAGPIGGQAAYLLAKKGCDVHLYEEHAQIGVPIQCTGLMTVSLNDILIPTKEFLVNTTKRIEVIAPDGTKTKIKSKEYIVDRTRFDSHFVNKAIDAGATLHDQHRFIAREGGLLVFRDKKNNRLKKIKKEIVIGADGPLSTVAKQWNIYGKRSFYYGVQVRAKGTFDPDAYQTYFGNDIAPGLFAWIVPESDTIARVGLGTTHNSNAYFERFMKEHNLKQLDMQAGPIPIYNPQNQSEDKKENVYLVGDAATQVKATTLGGLIPGLKAAACLAEALEQGKDYEKLWKKTVGRDLWLHLRIRRTLDRFSDKDWNRLISLMGKETIKSALEKHDREKPFKLLTALLKEPQLLTFARHLIY